MLDILERVDLAALKLTESGKESDKLNGDEIPILRAFRRSGIRPFSSSSVERYRLKKLGEFGADPTLTFAQRQGIRLFGRYRALGEAIFVLCFLGLALSMVISLGSAIEAASGRMESGLRYAPFAVGVLSLMLAYLLSLHNRTLVEWRRVPLKKHRGYVPTEVRTLIAEVEFHYPEAEFVVEELERNKVNIDPLLIVKGCDGREFYIALWDKAGFVA